MDTTTLVFVKNGLPRMILQAPRRSIMRKSIIWITPLGTLPIEMSNVMMLLGMKTSSVKPISCILVGVIFWDSINN